MCVRFNNERVVHSTGEKIHPKNWNSRLQRAVGPKKNIQIGDLNFWLDKIEQEVKNIFRNLKIEGITPTPSLVKEKLSLKLNNKPEVVAPKMNLFIFIKNYIEGSKTVKRDGTIKGYTTTLHHLSEYSQLKNVQLDFENINMDFYNDFTSYLIRNLGHSQNTVAKQIKTLKVFLNAATEEGYNNNIIFRSKKFKRPTEDVTKIYLTTKEIDLMYDLDLSNIPRLDKVRDLFVIGCYTGLRFSDFCELKPENIEGDILKIKTQKTGEIVMIPFKGRAREIFNKYNGNFPTQMSNQKMNDYLKEIGEMAGITNEVMISKLKCGEMSNQTFKKFNLITCHCARRSFATNAHIAGLTDLSIMKITGHKTHKVFQGYIRFSQEENANNLLNHDFFNA
jgi:site-specific recombinase XerD